MMRRERRPRPRHWKTRPTAMKIWAARHRQPDLRQPFNLELHTSWARVFLAFVTGVTLLSLFGQWTTIFDINPAFHPFCYFAIAIITVGLFVEVDTRGTMKVLWNLGVVWLCGIFIWMMDQALFNGIITAGVGQDALSIAIAIFTIAVIFAASGRLQLSIILASVLWYLLGAANFLVYTFRGDPLFFGDLLALRTALDVSDGYRIEFTGNFVAGTLMLGALMVLALWTQRDLSGLGVRRKRILQGSVLTACVVAVACFMGGNTEAYYYSWDAQSNDYLYSFGVNIKMLNIKRPEGYDKKTVESITQGAKAEAEGINQRATGKKPTVIAVMNESFSDLKAVADFKTDVDYMPFYHSLQENTIKGNLYVDVLGGGTCDSEYTFLSGNTTAFVPDNARPYQLYVKENTPTLVSTLNDQGYTSHAIHPGAPNAWNRDSVYPDFGFTDFYTGDDFYLNENESFTRSLISDQATYDQVVRLYENRGTETPFIFDVTIANHGGYEVMTEDLEPVHLMNMKGSYPMAEVYLSLIKKADAEIQNLVTYFSNQSEPVVLVFFGDHQPTIEPAFYEEIMGKPMSEWTEEELQKRFVTPFFIWANYDIPEAEVGDLSVNYLSSLLLRTAGLKETAYNAYSLDMAKTLPVISKKGVKDTQGNYYALGDAEKQLDALGDYHMVMYNNLFDAKHRCQDVFHLDQGMTDLSEEKK